MPLEGEQSIVSYHAATIVGDLNELLSPSFHLNLYSGRAGVQGIFQ
jgi:hypothetical protein